MVILRDSREHTPLEFPEDIEVQIEALPVGDYMVRLSDGRVAPIAIERKALPDLWGSLTSGYPRFKEELAKAKELGIYLILGIEASLSKVAQGFPRSDFAGESMMRKLMTLWTRYGLQPVFCKNREELADFVAALFLAVERQYATGESQKIETQ